MPRSSKMESFAKNEHIEAPKNKHESREREQALVEQAHGLMIKALNLSRRTFDAQNEHLATTSSDHYQARAKTEINALLGPTRAIKERLADFMIDEVYPREAGLKHPGVSVEAYISKTPVAENELQELKNYLSWIEGRWKSLDPNFVHDLKEDEVEEIAEAQNDLEEGEVEIKFDDQGNEIIEEEQEVSGIRRIPFEIRLEQGVSELQKQDENLTKEFNERMTRYRKLQKDLEELTNNMPTLVREQGSEAVIESQADIETQLVEDRKRLKRISKTAEQAQARLDQYPGLLEKIENNIPLSKQEVAFYESLAPIFMQEAVDFARVDTPSAQRKADQFMRLAEKISQPMHSIEGAEIKEAKLDDIVIDKINKKIRVLEKQANDAKADSELLRQEFFRLFRIKAARVGDRLSQDDESMSADELDERIAYMNKYNHEITQDVIKYTTGVKDLQRIQDHITQNKPIDEFLAMDLYTLREEAATEFDLPKSAVDELYEAA